MIPNKISMAKKDALRPLKATTIQSGTFTADGILKAYSSGRNVTVTLNTTVDITKYPALMPVTVTDCAYAGLYSIVSVIGTTGLLLCPFDKTARKIDSAVSTGNIVPLGPVPFSPIEGTPIKNGLGDTVAITYTGNKSFMYTVDDRDAKLFQIVATSGSITSATVKWSLDGVNWDVFSPSVTGSGTNIGLFINLQGVKTFLRIDVVTAGTYYVMGG